MEKEPSHTETLTYPASNPRLNAFIGALAIFHEALGDLCGDPQMPMQQIRLLLALRIHDEILQADPPKYTGGQSSAISRNLSKLGGTAKDVAAGKSLGLLEAGPMEDDRRYNSAKLTRKGRQAIEAAALKASQMIGGLRREA